MQIKLPLTQSNRMSLLICLILCFLTIVIVVITTKKSIPVASVNVQTIVNDFSHQLTRLNASPQQSQRFATRFAKILPVVLKHYAQQHHVVIVSHKFVLAGSIDVTVAVEKALVKQLRSRSST